MKLGSQRWLLASASALSLIATVVPHAVAQTTAAVSGDVRRENGRSFSGVDVTIVELGVSAETGPDGRFRLPNIAPGSYTLSISFLGEELERRTINVDASGASVSVQLAESSVEDVIVVTGTRGALASARAQERAQDNLTNVVTADDIGNFADQNIAESLQRIPGASIQRSEGEGRTPTIRGLSEGFVTVTVDGTRLGSRTEDDAGDTRSVSLDVFSSDLLNGIEVSKTLLPNQDADSIGGSINLRTLSAFDRGADSFAVRGEYGFQEKSEDWNPRASFDFTRLFEVGAGRLGIAGGASWQRRNSLVDTINVDNGLRSTVNGTANEIIRILNNTSPPTPLPSTWTTASTTWTDPGNCATVLQSYCILATEGIYTPNAIDFKADPAERERLSGNINLEWRPTAQDEFFLRGTLARFTDRDVRNRQAIGLDPGVHEEIIALGANSAVIADVDIERRFRFSEQEDNLYTIAFGGDHARGPWTMEYQFDYSRNESDIPSAEARFRERDVIVRYTDLGIDGLNVELYPDLDGTNANPNDPARYDFRFVTAYDFLTVDEITTARLDVQRDFNPANRPGFVRFGVKRSERDREVDVTRFRVDSATPGLTLANSLFPQIPGGRLEGSDIQFPFAFELGAMEQFAWNLRETGIRQSSIVNPGDEVISFARDYTANEVVTAGYAMLNLELADRLEFTGGVRIEDTEWTTAGFVANRITYDEGAAEASTIIRNNLLGAGVTPQQILASSLGPRYSFNGVTLTPVAENAFATASSGENSYTDMFFNLNLRWEPVDDVVVRASFTQGIQRPNFDEASANAEFLVDETTDVADLAGLTTIAQIEQVVSFRGQAGTEAEPLRDPTLDPLLSDNFDLSLSWYPNSDTFFQVALFRKDITDFIVRVISNDAASFGFDPADFNTVNTYINGEAAWVQGVELSYAQNYSFLPGILSGLFFAGNVTLADSEQTDGVSGRSLTFQDQADIIGNLSFGWENERLSLRASGNYIGERLVGLNVGALGLQFPASDEYEQERWSMDINARLNVTDDIQVYFDAININDAEERKFFEGGGLTGPVFSEVENYGRTYQVGVRARF
jgi:TonB-dependent receptor